MPQRVYRFRDLRPAGVSFTRKHITTLEREGAFPMHFNLGERAVGWVADEVDAWVDDRIRRRGAPRALPAEAPPAPAKPAEAQHAAASPRTGKTIPASARKKSPPPPSRPRRVDQRQQSAQPRQEYQGRH